MLKGYKLEIRGFPPAGTLMAAAGMMSLAAVAFLHGARLIEPPVGRAELLLIPGSLILGTAIGGAAAVRWTKLPWRGLVWAALTAGLILLLHIWWAVPELSPGQTGDHPGARLDSLRDAVVLIIAVAAGVFLLPLFDPLIRRAGPTPRTWVLAVAAASLATLALLAERWFLGTPHPFLGLATVTAGGITAVTLAGAAIIISLAGALRTGAWMGGLAVLMWTAVSVAWWLSAAP